MATSLKDKITETFKLDPATVDAVIAKIEDLIQGGSARRVIVKDPKGATVIEAPLTVGVVGVALAPLWTAVGAIAALASDFTIHVSSEPKSAPQE